MSELKPGERAGQRSIAGGALTCSICTAPLTPREVLRKNTACKSCRDRIGKRLKGLTAPELAILRAQLNVALRTTHATTRKPTECATCHSPCPSAAEARGHCKSKENRT